MKSPDPARTRQCRYVLCQHINIHTNIHDVMAGRAAPPKARKNQANKSDTFNLNAPSCVVLPITDAWRQIKCSGTGNVLRWWCCRSHFPSLPQLDTRHISARAAPPHPDRRTMASTYLVVVLRLLQELVERDLLTHGRYLFAGRRGRWSVQINEAIYLGDTPDSALPLI